MSDKTIERVFAEKVYYRFLELGFSKNTANKISKLIGQIDIDLQAQQISLNCTDEFYRDQIINPQKHEIEKIIQECWGDKFVLKIISMPDDRANKKKEQVDKIADLNKDIILQQNKIPNVKTNLSNKIDADFNFAKFIVCENNKEAYLACLEASKNPGNIANPLFIYADTGLGKTHLLHAIGNEILTRQPDSYILYVSSNDFVNDIIHRGIRVGKIEEIRKKYNTCDVLLFDDVQLLANKDACQEEFLHIFNILYQKKKQIVICCNLFPKEIQNLNERLQSRFLQGFLVNITAINEMDKIAIIKGKLQSFALMLSTELIELIVKYASNSIREIEGLVKELFLLNSVLNKELLQKILLKRFPISSQSNSQVDSKTIIMAISQYFNIKSTELIGQNRQQKFVHPRHLAIFLIKDMLNLTLTEISKIFGKKNHTTIMFAINKIKHNIQSDVKILQEINKIREKILNLN